MQMSPTIYGGGSIVREQCNLHANELSQFLILNILLAKVTHTYSNLHLSLF